MSAQAVFNGETTINSNRMPRREFLTTAALESSLLLMGASAIAAYLLRKSILSIPQPGKAPLAQDAPTQETPASLPEPEAPILQTPTPIPLQVLASYARLDPISVSGHEISADAVNDDRFRAMYTNPDTLSALHQMSVNFKARSYMFVTTLSETGGVWKLRQQQAFARDSIDMMPAPTNDLSGGKGSQRIASGESIFFNCGMIIISGLADSVTLAYTERGKFNGFVPLEANRLQRDGSIANTIYTTGDYPGALSLAARLY